MKISGESVLTFYICCMKIMSYNVNGIRAAINKGFIEFLQEENPDILCLQEIKATEDQIPTLEFIALGYHCYWFPAQKKGYSGTAILSKKEALSVTKGCGHELFDSEGRIIQANFEDFSVISAYFPSGSSGDSRQEVKMEFLDHIFSHIHSLHHTFPKLIVCGDYNICHKPIDIHDPVSNKNSSGFLPEERAWMDKFFESGFVDTFRVFNSEPHQYTWWSYRAGARGKNKGWRIDYISVSPELKDQLLHAQICPQHMQSDHCPLYTEIK
jgi:exodeoxyribonuclease-3